MSPLSYNSYVLSLLSVIIMANLSTPIPKGRITARVPLSVQETLQKAANLTGVPLNAFVVQVALAQAQAIIDHEEMKNITLSATDAEWLLTQINNANTPNQRLKTAAASYQAEQQ